MRTGGAIGQAVGYAAALCRQHDCSPRMIYTDHLEELLHGLLETDATILARSRCARQRDGQLHKV